MKKLFSMIMILFISISLFACTINQVPDKPIDNDNDNTDTTNTDTTNTDDKVDTGFSGIYYSQTLQAEDPYFPCIIFTTDGKFTFVENVYEGMIENNGVYSINDKQIDCILLENNLNGFSGENLKELTFIKDGNDLILMNDLCMSKKLDVFKTEKRIAQEHSNPANPYMPTETVYKSTSELASPGYEPLLILSDNYSFVFSENTFHGMTSIQGRYEMDNWGNLNCIVEYSDDENLHEIYFLKVEDHYELQTDLILSRTGDEFYYYSGE